jgi:hypothetical protein
VRSFALTLLALLAACQSSVDSRVEALIERLRDPEPEQRDRAEAALRDYGTRAEAGLRAHVDDADCEVASRCRRLLLAGVDDATWYESAEIAGLDLQRVTWERLPPSEQKREWLESLNWLATTRASALHARFNPATGIWNLTGLQGLSLTAGDPFAVEFTNEEGGPALLPLCGEAACSRDDDPPLLALAFEFAHRHGLDLELVTSALGGLSLFPRFALAFRRRAEIFRRHWRAEHRAVFRP